MHRDELVSALCTENFEPFYHMADECRRETVGDIVHIRAILEFSNYCRRNCHYCGLQCQNKKSPRYRMSPEAIIQTGKEAYRAGYQTLVLQSGEDPYYTPELMGEIVRELHAFGLVITLSCGEVDDETYAYWRACGAERYLLKHETADKDLYAALHPGYSLDSRIHSLKVIKSLGYEAGSGFMIGLPGETAESIADNILLLDQLECDMAGIGPFLPHPDTPMRDHPSGSVEMAQRAVALTRILRPHMHLPATTSLGVKDPRARESVFSRGANVIMRKVTPEPYKSMYQIYPAKLKKTDIVRERCELEEFIKSLGRIPR